MMRYLVTFPILVVGLIGVFHSYDRLEYLVSGALVVTSCVLFYRYPLAS